MEQNETSKTQYNKGAGKEIVLLKYTSTMTPTAHDDNGATVAGDNDNTVTLLCTMV